MNAYLIRLLRDLQVTIERVYLRVEDPFPFAMGLLLPRMELGASTGAKHIQKKLRVENFSVFMERDPVEVSIDEIIKK